MFNTIKDRQQSAAPIYGKFIVSRIQHKINGCMKNQESINDNQEKISHSLRFRHDRRRGVNGQDVNAATRHMRCVLMGEGRTRK